MFLSMLRIKYQIYIEDMLGFVLQFVLRLVLRLVLQFVLGFVLSLCLGYGLEMKNILS